MENSTKQNSTKVIINIMWKLLERGLGQTVTFIVSIVVARILIPEDYGIVALVMVFITIANVFVSNGLGNSLIQKKDADNLDFSSVFYINILVGLCLYFIIFNFAPIIAKFYGQNELILYTRVLGIRIILASVNSIQQAYVSRTMQFKKFFLSTLIGSIFSGIVGIAMAYRGYGVWALIFQYLLGTIIDTIFIWFSVKWRPQLIFSWTRAKELVSYAWKILCASLLDNIYNESRNLIIGKVYTSKDLAFYNRGNSFPKLIITNIANAISSVLFPVLSFVQDDIKNLQQKMRKSIKIYAYLVFPIMIGLSVVAEPLVKILLTEKWIDCTIFLRIACVSYMTWALQVPMQEALKAIGRSDIFLKLEITRKVFSVFLLICIMKYGVFAIAVTAIFDNVFSSIIIGIACYKYLNYSYINQIKDILDSLILSLVMGIMIYLLTFIIKNTFLIISTQFIVGVCIYIVGSKILKIESFNIIYTQIKSFKKVMI